MSTGRDVDRLLLAIAEARRLRVLEEQRAADQRAAQLVPTPASPAADFCVEWAPNVR